MQTKVYIHLTSKLYDISEHIRGQKHSKMQILQQSFKKVAFSSIQKQSAQALNAKINIAKKDIPNSADMKTSVGEEQPAFIVIKYQLKIICQQLKKYIS